MPSLRILVNGVTGYIGGSVLTQLLDSTAPELSECAINVLTRDDSRATTFRSDERIAEVFMIKNFDDTEAIVRAASQNDIIINCGPGYHETSARALIKGLACRKQSLLKDGDIEPHVYYIHTDGTSNLSSTSAKGRVFSDKYNDIYEQLQNLNDEYQYPQRTVALSVVRNSLAHSIATTIIMSPTVVGVGSGQFNRLTVQYPIIMRAAIREGQVLYVGNGDSSCRYVHIQDLAKLYELTMLDWISGRRKLPIGKSGFVFSAAGEYSWKEAAAEMAAAGKAFGALNHDTPRSVSLEDASQAWNVPLHWCEMGFVASQRTTADIAEQVLGWTPVQSSKQCWRQSIKEDFAEVAEELSNGKGVRDWREEKI